MSCEKRHYFFLFTYFANKFSRDLGDKVRRGIERKKQLNKYNGGRPKKQINAGLIQSLRQSGLSLRQITARINDDRPKNDRVSFQTVMRVLQ